MTLNAAASSGVALLKCDVVPRPACPAMQAISKSIATVVPQRMSDFARAAPGSSPRSQATVHR